MGGEEGNSAWGRSGTWGLPPRGRGRADDFALVHIGFGITPAWAGKRFRDENLCKSVKDYPRVGGEESIFPNSWPWTAGLPPRGRGRVASCTISATLSRITPAWAGKRDLHSRRMGMRMDYPRVGGEENRKPTPTPYHWGLPPRGRGRGVGYLIRWNGMRITPAWAGKRSQNQSVEPIP